MTAGLVGRLREFSRDTTAHLLHRAELERAADEIERLDADAAAEKAEAASWREVARQQAEEIKRLHGAPTWRPIDTCPDGARVILWFRELGHPVVGYPEAYGYKTGSWKATHWMPAPPPPDNELAPGGITEPNASSRPESGTGAAPSLRCGR